jgi:hypothetical protein
LACAALGLALPATSARAEGYVMGAGSWPCAEVVEIMETGDPSRVGQVAGWVFGSWSAASFRRETGFVDSIEQVGGETILRRTVQECRNAPPDTFLYTLVNSMIANTK